MKKLITVTAFIFAICPAIMGQTTWKPNPAYIAPAKPAKDSVKANKVQCFGTCRDGHRCNRKVSNGTLCYQHSNQK